MTDHWNELNLRMERAFQEQKRASESRALRDHFAAAALAGFASQPRFNCGSVLTLTAKQCYELADAMLRERSRAGQNSSGGTDSAAKCTERDSANHDAAPAARASEATASPERVRVRGDAGTGDTPDSPKPINGPDPDSRVWETPVHTPAPHATPGEGSERREGKEPVASVSGDAQPKESGMIYNAIKRRDSLIAGYVESQRGLAQSLNRQTDDFTRWLRWQIEKRLMRLDTIRLIGREGLDSEATKTAGEVSAFAEALAYIERGWKGE